MGFTPPGRAPALPYALVDTQPLQKSMHHFGNALARRREEDINRQIGEAAMGGNLEGARDASYQHGRLGEGMQFGNALARRQNQQQMLKLKQAQAQRGPAPTSAMRNFEYAQQNPAFAKYQESRWPQTNVTVSGSEKSYDKAIGGKLADTFIKSQQSGSAAQKKLNDLNALNQALQDPNVYSGAGGDTVLGLKKLAQSFGVRGIKGVGSGELIQSISRKIALSAKDQLPGPLSNSDREFLVSMAPGLSKTPEGNRLIVGLAMLSQNYAVERAQEARRYAQANGGRLDSGFFAVQGMLDQKYQQQFGGIMQQLRSRGEAEPRSPLAGVPRVMSDADFDALPPGTVFMSPDGKERRKP